MTTQPRNTITASTSNLIDSKAPLYHKYQGQFNPQPAYIELDCRGGELVADWNGEIGNAIPFYYFHGLAVRWSVSSTISGASLKTILSDTDFLAECQAIVDGFEVVWDGSNHVGRYADDWEEHFDNAERIIEQLTDEIEVWTAEDWLFTSCNLCEHWKNQPIEEAVAELEACIEDNMDLDGDIEEALIEKAKELFDYRPEYLTRIHIDELLRRDEISESEAAEWRRDQCDKIGEWDLVSAHIANDIAGEYADDSDDGFIAIQRRALEIMGGEILPTHTWSEYESACESAAEELAKENE